MFRRYQAAVEERHDALDRLSESNPTAVTIVGAGMSGLVAALELAKRGHAVTVLEATDRLGGRAHTWRVRDQGPDRTEFHHEFGAMRIPILHRYTRKYVEDEGLGLRRFVTAHEDADAWYWLRNRRFQMKDAGEYVPGLYGLHTDDRDAIKAIHPISNTATVPGILMKQVLEPVLARLTPLDVDALTLDGPPTDLSRKLEATSLRDLIAEGLRGSDALELVGAVTGLDVWWHIACTLLIREAVLGDDLPFDEISEGTDELPKRMAARAESHGARITLGTAVVGIELLNDGRVKLRTQPTEGGFGNDLYPQLVTGSQINESEHDVVLCTLPFSVLRGMDLTGLTPQKMAAIRMLNYVSSSKVLLFCGQRRWERTDSIYGGATMSDTILRATYYPSDHQDAAAPTDESNGTLYSVKRSTPKSEMSVTPRAEPGVLVASYNWGRDAQRMAALPHEHRKRLCVSLLERIHPGIGDDVLSSASMCWDQHPWARGAFALPHPHETSVHFENGRRPEGGLYFAGEHLSFNTGWIQGALISGLDAIEQILSRNRTREVRH